MATLYEDLRRHEGLRLQMYKCPAGFLTVGYGHNLETTPITKRAAEIILADDIQAVENELDRALSWWVTMPESVRNVMVNMAYQMGIHGLMGFKKFLAALQLAQWDKAAIEMLDSQWATQTPKRAHELAEVVRNVG